MREGGRVGGWEGGWGVMAGGRIGGGEVRRCVGVRACVCAAVVVAVRARERVTVTTSRKWHALMTTVGCWLTATATAPGLSGACQGKARLGQVDL